MGSPTLLVIWAMLSVAISASPTFQGQIYDTVGGLRSDYDYVVVGGGTSGLTVANRLSEDSGLCPGKIRIYDCLTEIRYNGPHH